MALGCLWWRAWFPVDAPLSPRLQHRPSLCVAGAALGDMDIHFAWQAWHLWHWAASGGALGSQLTPLWPRLLAWQAWDLATQTFTLRGRRGPWRYGPSLCVAGMALGDIDLHFAWQAWLLETWTFTLHGRRGTSRHGPSLCVAGVALMALGCLWWRGWFPVDQWLGYFSWWTCVLRNSKQGMAPVYWTLSIVGNTLVLLCLTRREPGDWDGTWNGVKQTFSIIWTPSTLKPSIFS